MCGELHLASEPRVDLNGGQVVAARRWVLREPEVWVGVSQVLAPPEPLWELHVEKIFDRVPKGLWPCLR